MNALTRTQHITLLILNSSLQVALALALLGLLVSDTHLTLVLPPLVVAVFGLAGALGASIVYDGGPIWLEGVALMELCGMIGAAFWWR